MEPLGKGHLIPTYQSYPWYTEEPKTVLEFCQVICNADQCFLTQFCTLNIFKYHLFDSYCKEVFDKCFDLTRKWSYHEWELLPDMQKDNFFTQTWFELKNILPEKVRTLQQIQFATKKGKRPNRPK